MTGPFTRLIRELEANRLESTNLLLGICGFARLVCREKPRSEYYGHDETFCYHRFSPGFLGRIGAFVWEVTVVPGRTATLAVGAADFVPEPALELLPANYHLLSSTTPKVDIHLAACARSRTHC